ncbi:hypothetical protein CAI21_17530 [Alkalilimnicola ehrlichii]|nr:hypothetical protein CAI21_17530 [Alkalilimnicola ehrlichii]
MTVHRPGLATSFIVVSAIAIALWLSTIVTLGALGVFHVPAGSPPLPTLIAIAVPPTLFLALLKGSAWFREQVLAIDPVWLVAVHGLRILGAGFLVAYALGALPGIFAHPAGWGDILVALLAPFVAVVLARNAAFLRSKWLWRFHFLGMLDFVGAVGSGLIARHLLNAGYDMPTTGALSQFPLLLIPCFAVPLWICLHLAAFYQIRSARQQARDDSRQQTADAVPAHP